jgi:hypothetical protein
MGCFNSSSTSLPLGFMQMHKAVRLVNSGAVIEALPFTVQHPHPYETVSTAGILASSICCVFLEF